MAVVGNRTPLWSWVEVVDLAKKGDCCSVPIELLLHDAEQRGTTPDLMSELMQLEGLRAFLRVCDLDEAECASQILVQILRKGRQAPGSNTGALQVAALLQSKLLGDMADLLDGQAKGRVVFCTSVITVLFFAVNFDYPLEQILSAGVHARLLTRSMALTNQLLPFKAAQADVRLDSAVVTQLLVTTRTMVTIFVRALTPQPDAAQVVGAIRDSFSREGMEAEVIRLLHGLGLALKGGAGSAQYCCGVGTMERKLVRIMGDISQSLLFIFGMVDAGADGSAATIRKELLSMKMYGCDVLELLQPAFAALVDVVYRKNGSGPGKLSKDDREDLEVSLRSTSVAAHLSLIVLLQLMLRSITIRKDLPQTSPAGPMLDKEDVFNCLSWAIQLGSLLHRHGYEPLLQQIITEEAPLKGQQADYLRKAGGVLLQLSSTVGPQCWHVMPGTDVCGTPLTAEKRKVLEIILGAELSRVMLAMHDMEESINQLADTLDEPVPDIIHAWSGCYHGNDHQSLPFAWLKRRAQRAASATSARAWRTPIRVQQIPGPLHEVQPGQARTGAVSNLQSAGPSQAITASHGPVCFTCGAPAEPGHRLKRCAGCLTALYCNVRCQKVHWKAGLRESCSKDVQEPEGPTDPPAAASSAAAATAAGGKAAAAGSASPVTGSKQASAPAADGKPTKPAAGGAAASSRAGVVTASAGKTADPAGGSAEAVSRTTKPAVHKTAASGRGGARKATGGLRKRGSTQPTSFVF